MTRFLIPSLRIVLLVFCLHFFQFWVVHLGFFMELHQWQSRKCSISIPPLPWNTLLAFIFLFSFTMNWMFSWFVHLTTVLTLIVYDRSCILHLKFGPVLPIAYFFLWASKSIIGYSQLLNQFFMIQNFFSGWWYW